MANTRMLAAAVAAALVLAACGLPGPERGAGSSGMYPQDSDVQGMLSSAGQEGGGTPQSDVSPARQELALGVADFGNGSLKSSERALLRALEMGLSSRYDQILAHKHLAFIYCVSRRKKACHAEFRYVLGLDSSFTLTSAEAGHPMWGPVFRAEKARDGKSAFARYGHEDAKGPSARGKD